MKEIAGKSILVWVSKGSSYQEAIEIVLKLPEKWFVVVKYLGLINTTAVSSFSHKITFNYFCFLTRQLHGMMIITGKWKQIALKETENRCGLE